MKWIALGAALVGSIALLPTAPAQAGCVKGAIIGGIAGHFAGNHGLLGAGAGCAVGHHMSNRNYYRGNNYTTSNRYYSRSRYY